jgi:localization factor PodJL
MSVGEWLNDVIQPGDDDPGEPMRFAEYEGEEDDGWRDEPRPDYRHGSGPEYREPPREPKRRRRRERDYEREAALDREARLAREEFGEVHARLDRLTQQLERMAHDPTPRLTGSPPQPQRGRAPAAGLSRPVGRPAASGAGVTVDAAVAEIAERQRALYGDATAAALMPESQAPPPTPPPASPPSVPAAAATSETSVDIGNLEEQLRYITTRIESLRPSNDLERVINSFRKDLTEIRQQLTEALPRRAVESLEFEVQALAKRLDHSRGSGADLGGLERGLAEVHEALRNLTPAENLVGFDEAVRTLSQKVDQIIAKEDPATLQQLETAIGALRGIVSHVASNDTMTKVAEDVRSLAAKLDDIAINAASGQAVSALESRIDTLANALHASTEAGQSVPRELEKLLSGLIEKLEWVQLTHTDHAALGHLEDRIAQLIKRLDASDARLGNLEAVERGLADLLVHVDQIRAGHSPVEPVSPPADTGTIERQVAEIKRSDRRTQDSLEAVHGAVEHVVDRLAMIESGMHEDTVRPPIAEQPPPKLSDVNLASLAPAPIADAMPALAPAESGPPRTGAARTPIDPNLPPDHPLEPGSTGSPRAMPSAADRIAASEAVVDKGKPAAVAEPEQKPDYIAAARRAAQAAASAPAERPARVPRATIHEAPQKPSWTRKAIVAVAALLILVGGVRIALHMFQDGDSSVAPPLPSEQAAPPATLPETDSAKEPAPSGPLVLPVPGSAPDRAPNAAPGASPSGPQSAAPNAPAGTNSDAPPPAAPGRQSSLPNDSDVTDALPHRAPSWPRTAQPPVPPPATADAAPAQAPAPAMVVEKLPATIGGPTMRAAAMAGDVAAEYEIATRFTEGHGVPPSNELAAQWLDRAAKQGLAPAQFRLGGLYEKGIGVKKDLAAARDLYTAAATKGNGKAMHNLAVLYAEGINGPADYRSAAHWFRKAADYGITDSQYNLAILYARGIGVEQNYAEAYKWFALGAIAGDNEAAKKRDEIASHLDVQSLGAAQAAVQNWAPQPQPEAAVNVKTPPGGWDPPAQSAKPKPHQAGAKPAAADVKLN